MEALIAGKSILFVSMQSMGLYLNARRLLNSRSVLSLLLCIFLAIPGMGDDLLNDSLQKTTHSDPAYQGVLDQDGSDMLPLLLTLLRKLGVDISYGDEGDTIFAMVDRSLTQIIEDLSSGQIEGFTRIPLINETFKSLGIEPAEIIMVPDEAPGHMAAIDAYSSRYPPDT